MMRNEEDIKAKIRTDLKHCLKFNYDFRQRGRLWAKIDVLNWVLGYKYSDQIMEDRGNSK